MEFNDIETEVIFLKAIKEFIDDMVNFEVIMLIGDHPHHEIRFNSTTHKKYFNIILLDFLSCSDKNILGKQLSYLTALREICEAPNFNENDSIKNLAISTKEFTEWLEKEVVINKIWLASIDMEIDLSIKRIEFIKICGNISKHNFSRLSGVVRDLTKIFKRNEIILEDKKVLLILGEFYEWFHDDIFSYHSSVIAEFLNNLRWGIYEYLHHEYQQSIIYEDTDKIPKYHCTYPEKINNDFAKNCYWDLMNEVCSKPYMKKFQVTRYLKMRY